GTTTSPQISSPSSATPSSASSSASSSSHCSTPPVQIPRACLDAFVLAVREHYLPNPYHNFHHALNTVYLCSDFLRGEQRVGSNILQSLDVFTCLTA
ncbi:unnamed protein product, partial [Amoebophrya sp. A25]